MIFFVIGVRRSGTTLLYNLINSSPSLTMRMKFEPHELWWACSVCRIPRYKDHRLVKEIFSCFEHSGPLSDNIQAAAKFALNPGIDALGWKYLKARYPESKFVFIKRRWQETWASYQKADKNTIRGTLRSSKAYAKIVGQLWEEFDAESNGICIEFTDLVYDPDRTIGSVCDFLQIARPRDTLKPAIKRPEQGANYLKSETVFY